MAYTPKTSREILRDLRGMVLGRTDLNDIFAGSVMNTLLTAISQEIASSDRRLYNIREAFFLRNASGQDLDERVGELPPVGISRITATTASGSVLTITRSETTDALSVPAGSLVSSSNGIQYRTSQETVFPVGSDTLRDVHIVATTAGSLGNALTSDINTIINMPDGVITVTNDKPLTNGLDQESDEDLRERAQLYLQSLTRSTRTAIEFLGTSFISSDGSRMRFAKLFEDPDRPGHSELIVDDGTGLEVEAISRPGNAVSGVIPQNKSGIIFHSAPATEEITKEQLTVTRQGVPVELADTDIKSLPERGIVYLNSDVLQEGDLWEIDGYRIFTGLISELQEEIEGSVENPSILTGFRAAGTRCVVKLAEAQEVQMDMSLYVEYDADYEVVQRAVRETLVNFINDLAPSQPLYVSALIEAARSVSGVRDIELFQRGTRNRLENQYAASPRVAFRVNSNSINISSGGEG